MRFIVALVFTTLLFHSCKENEPKKALESTSEGTISITVEESFKSFIDQELKVFASSYPKARINVQYKSEIDCFKDFAEDSTRMIFVTRGLDKREQAHYKDQLGYAPTFGVLAYNAIAVVVHQNAKDSIFTLQDLHDRLIGKNPQQVVMDGSHLTGIVRFLKDSLVKADKLGKNVMAANGSKEVMEYLKNNPKALQFFKRTWGVDEVIFQTILLNSPLKDSIINNNLRFIEFEKNAVNPRILTQADAKALLDSGKFIARKFSLEQFPEIILFLDNELDK